MKIPASTLKKMAAGAGGVALATAIAASFPATHATTIAPEAPGALGAPEGVVQDRILDEPTTDPTPDPTSTPRPAPTATAKPRPRPIPREHRDPCPGCGMG